MVRGHNLGANPRMVGNAALPCHGELVQATRERSCLVRSRTARSLAMRTVRVPSSRPKRSKSNAAPHERTDERQSHRNGYRERRWETRAGSVELEVPKWHRGSYFPELLEPRRAAE